MGDARPSLAKAKRIVIKTGSALIVDDDKGEIREGWLDALATDIARCRARGQEVIVVSSGAISTGRRQLGLAKGPIKLEQKQAAAAVGQIRIVQGWKLALKKHDITAAQILLTPEDTEARNRHLNARATINALLELGAVPVINENDTIATEEIRFGDNDRLAARVAQMASADTLVLLSDIDGLYTADPRKNKDATFIPVVAEITPEIENMADKPPPGYSSGGMITKLAAAKIAVSAGCHMVIARGNINGPLSAIEENLEKSGTWFIAKASALSARKKWIAGHIKPAGEIRIDSGAAQALLSGKSLLPAGVREVSGNFLRGDLVAIINDNDKEIGRGLSAYSAEDARKIAGRKSLDIASILGFSGREEMIHRDDLVLT